MPCSVARVLEVAGDGWTALDTNTSATTAEDTWYNARVVYDGASIDMYRWEEDVIFLYMVIVPDCCDY